MEVNRIAIAKEVFKIGCSVAFSAITGQWTIEYKKNGSSLAALHVIEGYSIKLLRYYSGGKLNDTQPCFICMKINTTTMNGLANIEASTMNGRTNLKNERTETNGADFRYVLIEFPCRGHIEEVVNGLRKSWQNKGPNFSGFQDVSNVELTFDEVPMYAKVLLDATDKDSKSRPHSSRNGRKGRGAACSFDRSRKRDFLNGRKEETVLLVYPFAGNTEMIDAAAFGLTEANCASLKAENTTSPGESVPKSMVAESKPLVLSESEGATVATMPENPPALAANTNQRGDYVAIRVKDYDRLDPGEWLNDSLIDFWMQW
jgi:hypothetical protein